MVTQLIWLVFRVLLICLVGLVESVVGVPFLFYFLSFRFLQRYSLPVRVVTILCLSLFAAAALGISASILGLILLIGLVWLRLGQSVIAQPTVRLVLAAFAATAVSAWVAEVIWTDGVLLYTLGSVSLGAILVYWPQRLRQGPIRYLNVGE